mmetsp:Transcript_18636/g.40333  ORF Transcript_18636/g.40333 Transcript_18636/m.40333 type:complete len:82 (-) Transcript_18636:1799-2044(-)
MVGGLKVHGALVWCSHACTFGKNYNFGNKTFFFAEPGSKNNPHIRKCQKDHGLSIVIVMVANISLVNVKDDARGLRVKMNC